MTDIAELFARVLSPSVARDAVRDFLNAIAFNWLICGTDAHAKNYALLFTDAGRRTNALLRHRFCLAI